MTVRHLASGQTWSAEDLEQALSKLAADYCYIGTFARSRKIIAPQRLLAVS